MKVKYTGPFAYVEAAGLLCKRGDAVEVTDDVGRSLLEQEDNWQPVKPEPKSENAGKSAGEKE